MRVGLQMYQHHADIKTIYPQLNTFDLRPPATDMVI